MSNRVQKKKPRDTTQERKVLAEKTELDGVEDMPCSRCWNTKPRPRCVVAEGSRRCARCVRLGKSCDGTSVASLRMLRKCRFGGVG